MASEFEIKKLLREAAEKLVGRRLSESEIEKLYLLYQQEVGTPYKKTINTLQSFSSLSESQILQKRSASDDFDRVMRDIKRELEGK